MIIKRGKQEGLCEAALQVEDKNIVLSDGNSEEAMAVETSKARNREEAWAAF